MEVLTHPQAYYEFFGKYYYRGRKAGVIAGGVLLLLAAVIMLVRPVKSFVSIMLGESTLAVLLPVLLLAGIALIVGLLLLSPKYRSITLFPNGFALAGREGKVQIPFSQVCAVMEYRTWNRRFTKVHLYGQPKPVCWSDKHLRDYRRCLAKMEKLRADYVLGGQFPENIAQLELVLSEEIRLTGGRLCHNDAVIAPVNYQAAEYEQIRKGTADVVIMLGDAGQISLTPERIGNRTAMLRVLEHLCAQNEDAAIAE